MKDIKQHRSVINKKCPEKGYFVNLFLPPRVLTDFWHSWSTFGNCPQCGEMLSPEKWVDAKFGDNWKDHAEKNYTKEQVIDIAFKNGREVIILKKEIEDLKKHVLVISGEGRGE